MSEDCQKEDHNYVYPNPGWGVTIYGYKPENCPYCEIDRLAAELDRYKQGVELRCFLDFNELLQKSVIDIDDQTFSADLIGRRVRVLVMKEEE